MNRNLRFMSPRRTVRLRVEAPAFSTLNAVNRSLARAEAERISSTVRPICRGAGADLDQSWDLSDEGRLSCAIENGRSLARDARGLAADALRDEVTAMCQMLTYSLRPFEVVVAAAYVAGVAQDHPDGHRALRAVSRRAGRGTVDTHAALVNTIAQAMGLCKRVCASRNSVDAILNLVQVVGGVKAALQVTPGATPATQEEARSP